MLSVGSITTRDLVDVPPDCPLDRARELLRERRLRHLLVVERGRLVGVVSERDLLRAPEAWPVSPPEAEPDLVRDHMSIPTETADADEPVASAVRRMVERRIGCLPLVREGRPVGVLSESDALRLYARVARFIGRAPGCDPPVEQVMSRDVTVVGSSTTAMAALELCRSEDVRHLPVVYDGWLVGIVSDRDLLPAVSRGEGQRQVEDLMTKDFVAVNSSAPLSEAAEAMLREGIHALPVLRNGALKGIVTSLDVLRALCALDQDELAAAFDGERELKAAADPD